MSKSYAIQDSNGKYVDDKAVRENNETGEWYYRTYDYFYAPCRLSASVEEAEKKIKIIEKNLHKVKNIENMIFIIKEVV